MARSVRDLNIGMLAAACGLALACGGGGGSGGGGGGGAGENCGVNTTTQLGEYLVENNSYNNTEAKAPATPIPADQFTQCASLVPGKTAGTVDAAWRWSWPVPTREAEHVVRATPTIVYGFKPWNPSSTTSHLPARVSAVGSLRVDAETVQEVPGKNLQADFDVLVYLTDSDRKVGNATVLPINASLMIVWNAQGLTFGTPTVSNLRIGGEAWDLYAFSGSAGAEYVRRSGLATPATSLHLDVADFLADAQGRGLVTPTWWVASVETASILLQGEGSLALKGYKVTFAAPAATHALTVARTGAGSGRVASIPAGISCGATCSATFASDAMITLTPTPDAGSAFLGWSGDCTGTEQCVVSLRADRSVTASFGPEPSTYPLSVTVSGAGTGTVRSSDGSIFCGQTCDASIAPGTVVTLTAVPQAGSSFAGWSGPCNLVGFGDCDLLMFTAHAVTAVFDRAPAAQRTCETPSGRLYLAPYFAADDTYMNTLAPVPILDYSQCASAIAGSTAGAVSASWTWSWPNSTVARSTPTVVYGQKPWDTGSTSLDLPTLVSNVGSLTIDTRVTQLLGPNTVAELVVHSYLTTSLEPSNGSLPIAKKLFVYPNVYGVDEGAPAWTQVPIGQADWDVIIADDLVMYVPHERADEPATVLHLDMAEFLADAIARGAVDPSWYLVSVETGAVVYQGEGALILTDYQVRFQAASN